MARRRRVAAPRIDYLDRVDEERGKVIRKFIEENKLRVKDLNLLNRGLSHKSYTNERGLDPNEQSEKLEFFGDGVLGLVVNEYLFKCFPEMQEGDLAKIKSAVVSETTLAEIARQIGLGDYILLGRGEASAGGRERAALLADTLEAVIGAIYIDSGLASVRAFILRNIESRIKSVSRSEGAGDYKSMFQEWVQKKKRSRPVYSVLKASGPDHSKVFRVAVSVDGRRWGVGEGHSKKEAEAAAAEEAYLKREEREKNGGTRSSARGKKGGAGRSGTERGSRGRARPAKKRAGSASGGKDERKRPAKKRAGSASGGKDERKRPAKKRAGSASGGKDERKRPARKKMNGRRSLGPPDEEIVPPKDVDDPVAWAAAEDWPARMRRTSTRRRGRR